MQPVLLDLSQWRPFGVALDSFFLRVLAFAVFAGMGLAAGSFLVRRRAARKGRFPSVAEILVAVSLLPVAGGLLWAVSKLHAYGLMMALGFLTAIGVGRWRARRSGEDPEVISTLGILALIGGVTGARLSYVMEHWGDFAGGRAGGEGQLAKMLKLTSGGLVFDGGLVLAVLLVGVYLWRRRLPIRRFLDILAICSMIGLAFGRVGCLLNGCCYGGVCREEFPLALHFPYAAAPWVYPHAEGKSPYPPDTHTSAVYDVQASRYGNRADRSQDVAGGRELRVPEALWNEKRLKVPGELRAADEFEAARAARALAVEPAQVYGMVNALVLTALLYAVYRLRRREGQVFALMLVFYPLTRFMLEIIRDDNPNMALTPAQWKCLVILALGVGLLGWLRRLPASCGPVWADRTAAESVGAGASARGRRKRRTSA